MPRQEDSPERSRNNIYMADGKRGSEPLGREDWVFGSAPRRRLLRELLSGTGPREGWTKAGLARAVGLSPNGGVDEHVAGLAALGLLEERGGRWHPHTDTRLARALGEVLRELERLP